MVKKAMIRTLALCCAIFALGCHATRNISGLPVSKDFQTLLDTSVNDKNIGILLHVESPDYGISWSGASGFDDFANKTTLQENACFRIASVTKTFVACSILRLWEEGKLSLDDPISKYISAEHTRILQRGTYDADKIAIRHLITHSSGLFDHTNAPAYFERIEKDPAHVWTRTEQLEALVNWGKPVGGIGEKFSYSDTGYILLAEILEKISGKSMGDAFEALLRLKAKGLSNTQVEDALDPDRNPKNRIHQYTQGVDTYHWNPSIDLYGGGGLLSTTKDLSLFFQDLFQHKVFRQKTTLDTMLAKTTYSSTEKLRMDYRKGIYLVKIKDLDAWTHTGYWGTQVVYIPSLNTTIAAHYSNGWQVRGQAPVLEKVVEVLQR
jgi:D-alanyl-D-alanine carboxypeptidase